MGKGSGESSRAERTNRLVGTKAHAGELESEGRGRAQQSRKVGPTTSLPA